MKIKVDIKCNSDGIERAIVEAMKRKVVNQLSAVKCPHHGRQPQIHGTGRSLSDLKWDVKACCEDFVAEIKAKISAS
jgi:hypothetical protein